MRIGIVGAGNISDTHARAAASIPGVTVAAVCGENRDRAEALAARHGARCCESLPALVSQRLIDAVIIGSPSGCHAEQATLAVRHGLHVLVEKPLDVTTARIDALVDEVARARVTLAVCFQDRLAPDVVRMKALIDAGEIGAPILATGEVRWYRPPEYYSGSRWRGKRALDGGGALMNQGSHTVDLLVYLMGPVVSVSGAIATRLHAIETEDTAVATLHFASGALGTIYATTASYPGYPRRLSITGSEGTMTLEDSRLVSIDLRGREAVRATNGEPRPENAASPVVSDISGHRRIIEDFLDAVRTGRAPACSGSAGRESVAVIEAAYASAGSGESVKVRAPVTPTQKVMRG